MAKESDYIFPYLVNEYDWKLKKPPNPRILIELIVDCTPATIVDVTCDDCSDRVGDEKTQGSQYDLMTLQVWG